MADPKYFSEFWMHGWLEVFLNPSALYLLFSPQMLRTMQTDAKDSSDLGIEFVLLYLVVLCNTLRNQVGQAISPEPGPES